MKARSLAICATWVLGCGPVVDLNEGESSGGSQGTSSTTSATITITTTTMSGTSASASGSTGSTIGSADDTLDGVDTRDSVGFIDCGAAPPGSSHHCLGVPDECDLGYQICVSGEKCSPWANDGGNQWNDAHCVPLDDTPSVAGESCMIEGSPWSGIDDCDEGLFCVPQDDLSLWGICWELCEWIPDGVECDTGTCVLEPATFDLPVCEPACDPVLQDCVHGRCDAGREPFGCKPTVGPGAELGEACEVVGDCVAGATCLGADSVPGCTSSACCAAYCDRLAPDPDLTCGEGLVCTNWFEPGMGPAGYEHVGVCVAA